MKKLLFLLLITTFAVVANAQDDCRYVPREPDTTKFDLWFSEGWALETNIGANFFIGDIASQATTDRFWNIGLQKNITSYLFWRFNGSHGLLYGEKAKFADGSDASLKFNSIYTEAYTTLKLDLFGFSENLSKSKVAPYVYAGLGLISFRSKLVDFNNSRTISSFGYDKSGRPIETTTELEVPFGVGLEYKISPVVAMTFNVGATYVHTDKLDAFVSNTDKNIEDMFANVSIGVIYKLGNRDCDKDGVVNRKDKCPDTPLGIAVDENGCPFDKDGDGVPDYQDKCPNEAGLVEFDGCPDKDGDGIPDYQDKCPDEAGLAEFSGCPDRDGDGVPDYEDKCPDHAGPIENSGCPDSDGDGIPDHLDKCPDEAGLPQFDGCPDKDGDGIPDYLDKCPDVAGIQKNLGCPAVKKEVLRIFEKALTGIQFETGKDVIKKTSFPILDQVVKAMVDNPEYNLEINGHTDNVGDSGKNQILSEKRAAAVRKYMIDKGVADNRMISHGYGDTQPVADNKTKAGKAKNRRVEFKVVFSQIEIIEEQ